MTLIHVEQESGSTFKIRIRGHTLTVDMHKEEGGRDEGPTPVELLVAAVATCACQFGRLYCENHGLPAEGFQADVTFQMSSEGKRRIERITGNITLPDGIPEKRRAAVDRAARACPVHHTLEAGTEIDLSID